MMKLLASVGALVRGGIFDATGLGASRLVATASSPDPVASAIAGQLLIKGGSAALPAVRARVARGAVAPPLIDYLGQFGDSSDLPALAPLAAKGDVLAKGAIKSIRERSARLDTVA